MHSYLFSRPLSQDFVLTTLSGPDALFSLRSRRSFRTPSQETFISGIDGEGGSIGDGMFTGSSWVNTDWYCLFSISALLLGSEKRILLFLRGAVPTRSFFVALCIPKNSSGCWQWVHHHHRRSYVPCGSNKTTGSWIELLIVAQHRPPGLYSYLYVGLS